MKILLVSMYFAPFNAMGALRVSRLAEYLLARGHDVQVLTAADLALPCTLPSEFPVERIQATRWLDVNAPPRALSRLKTRVLKSIPGTEQRVETGRPSPPIGWHERRSSSLGRLYVNLFNWPDARMGWMHYALRAGTHLARDWQWDLIYASSPPPTGLVVASLLAKRTGAPWVAELRDRWVDDPYYPRPAWRTRMEATLERWTLRGAAALVTVSEPWAAFYRNKYGMPAEVVYNGFDPEDYDPPRAADAPGSDFLRIVYTGGGYPGRRDPAPLFEALARLDGAGQSVRVEFYGSGLDNIAGIAERHGLAGSVVVHPPVPYQDSIRLQQGADVLLLMQWNDPREQGNVPGKLFEYLAARRPILGLGLETGVPAQIIRERAAGVFSNDPLAIADQLAAWLETKRRNGGLESLPPSACAGFTRQEQYATLESFLERICLDR